MRIRVRRGPDILGTFTELELAERLASGEFSEFDVVSPSEDGDDWMPIQKFVAELEAEEDAPPPLDPDDEPFRIDLA